MSSEEYDALSELYSKLIKENINILQARGARKLIVEKTGLTKEVAWTYVIAEFSYEKPDGRVIWPKIAAEGRYLKEAVSGALLLVRKLREA